MTNFEFCFIKLELPSNLNNLLLNIEQFQLKSNYGTQNWFVKLAVNFGRENDKTKYVNQLQT